MLLWPGAIGNVNDKSQYIDKKEIMIRGDVKQHIKQIMCGNNPCKTEVHIIVLNECA